MCEDKSYLWLEKVTDKDIKEEDLKVHLLNNQEIRLRYAQFWFTLVCRSKGNAFHFEMVSKQLRKSLLVEMTSLTVMIR